jgi:uncharacterized protein (TIGR02246 family)
MTAYGRYFSAGHTDSLLAFYADQAHVMPPNSRQVQGRDAVRQMYAAVFQNGPTGVLRFHVDDVTANGPVAVLRASWTFTPPAGAPMPPDTGAGMGVWRKTDGHWKIMSEIWRSDLPVPAPAPPHRRG